MRNLRPGIDQSIKMLIRNCFWLLTPALAWNAYFTPKLADTSFAVDGLAPQALLFAETVLRITVFAAPVFLTMKLDGRTAQMGLILLAVGYLLYFGSWLPHLYFPESDFARSLAGFISPYATPLIFFFGIALIARSALYAAVSVLFTMVHVAHGFFSFLGNANL